MTSAITSSGSRMQKNSFLHFSRRTDYGLILLMELAKSPGQSVSLRNIAKKYRMSFFFFQKVANELKHAGLIEASRGKEGGYSLAKDPATINLLDILQVLEGPVYFLQCLDHDGSPECLKLPRCNLKSKLSNLNRIIIDSISNITFEDFLTSNQDGQN
jgi:Rrf2 family protein